MDGIPSRIIKISLDNIPSTLRDESIIFWNRTLLQKGDIILAGRSEYSMPFRGYYVFVDTMPQANWGHPALHLFIDERLENVEVIEDQFPPWLGDLPESVVVLYRYGSPPQSERDPDPFGSR